MPKYKLISFPICPFVQRSTITLEHKGVPYDIEFIDLSDKPDWFLELSPLGKVPVLVVEEEDREIVLFESAVINEYLDEITEGSLLPADPLLKARHRALIEFASAGIGDAWMMGTAKSREDAFKHAAKLRDKFARLESELVGPLFTGESLSLVDTATIPMLLRAAWTEEIVPELALFADFPKVTAWRDATMALEAVERSAVPDLRERYRQYLAKRDGSWVGGQVRG